MKRLIAIGLAAAALGGRVTFADQPGAPSPAPLPGPELQRLPPVEEPQDAGPVMPLPADEVAVCQPDPPPKLWEGSFELGLAGSAGNTDKLNFRFGFDAKRKTESNVLSLDMDYHRDNTEGEQTAHRALADWRWEWLFCDSPWTWFVHGTTDYDEFQAFDVRVALDTGLGYQFIDTERTTLLGRFGAGASREIGGPEDDWVPELVFGSEFTHQLTERQKVSASMEYTPDVTAFEDFRVRSKASWEVLLDADSNLSLKLTVLDRYDSTPHGVEPNDIDYTMTLLWSF